MLDLVVLGALIVVAFRVVRAVLAESDVFREFNVSRSVALAALLLPFGPLVFFLPLSDWLTLLLGVSCFIPALVLARRAQQSFEVAGTDRVKAAQSAASLAFLAAMLGLVYFTVIFAFSFAVESL